MCVNEVETITDDQLLGKAWAMKTIRERSYELRDQAARLRLNVERDANAAARRAMLPDRAAQERAWMNTNNPAIAHPRDFLHKP